MASQGAGLLFIGTVVLLNPIFVNNQSNDGGAIYATELSNLTVINGFIVGNHSFYGGAVTAEDKATVSLINTVVAHNTALGDGGGIYNLGSRIRLFNSVLAYNSSGADGGGLWEHTDHAKSGTEIVNSIIWGNTASGEGSQLFQLDVEPVKLVGMKRSLFQGPLPSYVDDDLLTIYSEPLFVDIDGLDGVAGTLDDDFRPSALSPAIDAGDNSLIPVDTLDLDVDLDTTDQIPFDLLNHQRIFDGGTGGQTVDLGPYEFGAPTLGVGRPGIRSRVTASVFPNPAHDEIIVQLDRPLVSAASVQVFDVLGRRTLIVHSDAGAAQIRIQTKYFASGSYVLFIGRGAEQLVAPVHFVILH